MKTGITYKFVEDHQWHTYRNLDFPFKEGDEIVFSQVGHNYKNHSMFEIVNGKNKGKKFNYDPYSIQLPVIELKDKIKFSTDSFIKLIKNLQIPNCNVNVYYVKKGEIISKYPCDSEKITDNNCFVIRNVNSGLTYIDEQADANTAMTSLLGSMKHTFSEKFKVKKIFAVASYGLNIDKNNYADSAFKLLVKD